MVEVYKFVDGAITKIDEVEDDCWVTVVSPTPEEREWLSTQLGVVPEFATASLDDEEHPHVDYDEDERQTLIIVDCPFIEDRAETMDSSITQYDTHPLSIVMLPKRKILVTVSLRYNDVIQQTVKRRVRSERDERHPKILLDMLMKIARTYLAALRDIDRQYKANERILRAHMRNAELIKMLGLEKSLVYFSTSLRSFEAVLTKLSNGRLVRFSDDDDELLEDVIVEVRQATEMCDISQKILNESMDAFSNIISNNMNYTISRLTIITLILAVPTIIFSFYGMNTGTLPLVDSWLAPLGIAAGLCVLTALIFMKGKFLK